MVLEFFQTLMNKKELAIEWLRIYLGIGLFLMGVHFVLDQEQLSVFLKNGSFDAFPIILSHYIILAQVCGGALLAVGLITRAAALVQLPVSLGASLLNAHAGVFGIGQTLEFSLLVSVLLLVFAIYGSGKLSVDAWLQSRSKI